MARGEAYPQIIRFFPVGVRMMVMAFDLKQYSLLEPENIDLLLKEWYRTHLYDPMSLGEILQEVLE